jgi:hypothetical protein
MQDLGFELGWQPGKRVEGVDTFGSVFHDFEPDSWKS